MFHADRCLESGEHPQTKKHDSLVKQKLKTPFGANVFVALYALVQF